MSTTPLTENFQSSTGISGENNLQIRVYEITTKVFEKNSSHLVNELYSRGVTFTIKISKEKTHLIIYSLNTLYRNESTRDSLLKHLQGSYSLVEIPNSENFFIPQIKKVEQEGKFIVMNYDNSEIKQYFLACMLSGVGANLQSINKIFHNFAKDLVQADIFSIILTQFATRDDASQRSTAWGIMFVAKSDDKESIKKKEKEFQRYISANTAKLNCQLQFLTKREITRYKTNFRLCVPWIKHLGVLSDIVNLPKLLSTTMQGRRIVVPFPSPESVTVAPIQPVKAPPIQPIITPKPRKMESSVSQSIAQRIKPYPSVRKTVEEEIMHEIPSVNDSTESAIQISTSNIEDLSLPTPRSMNAVFDTEYLKVRINKIFKEFEFKETVIFEENFDLVLRKGSYYVFVRFFKDILNQNNAYKIVENLSSIAGLRNQFLCIVVADVMEESARKLLSEYNILHLTLTDVLVNDSLKAKLYGTIIA